MHELGRAFAACALLLACVECVLPASVPVSTPASVPASTPASVPASTPASVTASASVGRRAAPHEAEKNATLIHELRRQLMENNYDYLPSESEELLTTSPSEMTTGPVGPSHTTLDITRLEFDLEFNDPKKDLDDLDTLNREHNKVDRRIDGLKKEYGILDSDRTDIERDHDEIDRKVNVKIFEKQLDRDYSILKEKHDKLIAVPRSREYDSVLFDEKSDKDFDKSNESFLGTQDGRQGEYDMIDEKHKGKHGKLHSLNRDIKEKLKKHHRDDNIKRNKNKYNKHRVREKDIDERMGFLLKAHDDNGTAAVVVTTATGQRDAGAVIAEKGTEYLPRAHDDREEESSGMSKKHGVHKNDLLYYINDERLKRAEQNYIDLSNADEGPTSGTSSSNNDDRDQYDDSDDSDSEDEPTTVKYNVFTVRSRRGRGRGRGGRRAGGGGGGEGGGRAFLREQRPDEVVLVRLDDAPFPQFRLPAARRQYMHSVEIKH